jgi:hypothetical protein
MECEVMGLLYTGIRIKGEEGSLWLPGSTNEKDENHEAHEETRRKNEIWWKPCFFADCRKHSLLLMQG